MSSQIAISKFMTDLAMHFPKKHESPGAEKAWLQSMVATLRGYSDDVLREAAQHIIDKRKDRFFPLPSELKDACDAAQRIQENITRAKTIPALRKPMSEDQWDARTAFANDLVPGPLGRQAASDEPCWVLRLRDFIVEHQRMPDAREIERLKREAREFDVINAECIRGWFIDGGGNRVAWDQAKMCAAWGAKVLDKREKLRAEVLGK